MKVPSNIINVISEHKSFLITAHTRPDGDAVGSQLAFYQLLKKMRKKVVIQDPDPVPANFRFLPQVEQIKTFGPLPFLCEVALILDSPSLARVGKVAQHLKKIPILVNIDHHVSNARFGQLSWVKPASSSVGEMLFHLLTALGIKLTRPIALCLYVAVLTDMGKFQFMVTPRAGVRVFKLAAELVKTGLIPYEIYKKVYNIDSVAPLKLLGKALNTLSFAVGGEIAYMAITQKMVERWGKAYDSTDYLIAFPRDISTTRVALLFTERDGRVKVSFRSKEPAIIDVNRIASQFGGGGHPAAAGVDLPGKLKEVERKVLQAVKNELNQLKSKKHQTG